MLKKINKELLSNITVLYVEDETMIREEVSFFFKKYIKNFYCATNGLEGIKLFNEVNPDIIITDIQMPKMNGLDMIKELNTNVPVIITTAYSDIEYFLKAIELKVQKFVIKPLDLIELVSSIQDCIITNNLQDKFFEKESLLKIINENVLLSIADKNGTIIDVSSAFCDFTGFSKGELVGQKHNLLKHEDTSDEFYKNMWQTILSGKIFESEIKNKKRNGEAYIANLTISPVFKDGEIVSFTTITQDITSKKRLEQLTIEDDLTKLYNRRHFNTVLEAEIKRIRREKSFLSFLIVDIDYFKKFNDMYGHPKGDQILKNVANILKKCVNRPTDYIFRLGGEEFGVLFSGLDIEQSMDFSKRIVEAIYEEQIEHLGNEIHGVITISAGLLVHSYHYIEDDEKVYKYSDDALYEAKHAGKNRVVLSKKSK
ncbi:hypothetical protein CP985_14440 [Malaciobacter mytili LMG 24559]|uniref:Diguanylate cyclase n=1 Tax=Malaciobacter mytili LMG 24559 TaxID=1032238 RepID=A0AAX2ACB7_9BACT|nr:hypothetical protein CP985_14440 [Malaciobacter mytili LMG 24559]